MINVTGVALMISNGKKLCSMAIPRKRKVKKLKR
jgi:hypothetical protein